MESEETEKEVIDSTLPTDVNLLLSSIKDANYSNSLLLGRKDPFTGRGYNNGQDFSYAENKKNIHAI